MGLSSILSTPLVLEDTIESVKSVGSKESSPNSISRNHSIEPMVPLSPTKFRADHGGKRETFRNKNWSRYHRSPRWSKVQRWWEEGRSIGRPAAGHLPSLGHEKGKEQNEFHKSNVSMDQLSKFFHHPPGKVAKNRFLPHHRPSTRPGHTFLFTLFPPVPEFPQFRESFVAKKYRDRTSWEIRWSPFSNGIRKTMFVYCRIEILNSSIINRSRGDSFIKHCLNKTLQRNKTVSNSSRNLTNCSITCQNHRKSLEIVENHRIIEFRYLRCHAWREIREILVALFRMPRSDRKRIRITLDRSRSFFSRRPPMVERPSFPWNLRIPVVYRCTTSFVHIRCPEIHA